MTLEVHDLDLLPGDTGARLQGMLKGMRTLEDVLAWARVQRPPATFIDAITQDEYTHDIVLRYRDDVYLVFDTT